MADPAPPNDPKFENLKYWIDLAKWFLVSVGIVVATMIIDSGFKDRAAGVLEIEAYGKYVTDLIVLNKEVGPRRLLAQYFSNVTASDKLREGWAAYYRVLNDEYSLIAEHDSALAREQRALALQAKLSPADSMRKREIQIQRDLNDQQLNAPIVPVPAPDFRTTDVSTARAMEHAALDLLVAKNADRAIEALDQAEQSYNGYHQVYEIGRYLKQSRAQLLSPDSTQAWKDALTHIATKLNYGMTAEQRRQLLERAVR